MASRRLGVFVCTVFTLWPSLGIAQEPLLRLLGPRAADLKIEAELSAHRHPEQEVAGQDATLSRWGQGASVSAVTPLGPAGEGGVSAEVEHVGLRSEARLPDSGDPLPDHLWGVRLGGTYRRFLEGGRWLGLAASVGSDSDEPFRSRDEVGVDATALYRVPWGEHSALLFLLNYSNTREFWNHVPLPGLAYSYQPSLRLLVLAGLPASFLCAQWESGWGVSLFYLIPRTARAEASYRVSPATQLLAAFHMDHEGHFRAGREHEDHRLFYYEKRLEAGLRHDATADLSLEAAAGYAFDRYYFEGRDFGDRGGDRIDVQSGPFLWGEVKVRF